VTQARLVRLVGCPLDGREIRTDGDVVEAVVAMADRTLHLYRATGAGDPDRPSDASIFVYGGRAASD
jgi:hypothetical protein